jgi:uncharacterized protein
MYHRDLTTEIQELAKSYPIVTILGPRQSGKTTITKMTFPEKTYVSLEDLDTRQLALSDPRGFLSKYPHGAILDEVQKAPELLSYIQTIVDADTRKGLFILTGSAQLELYQGITQTLAGRTSILTLLPMSLIELKNAGITIPLHQSILHGGYPRIYNDNLNPTKAYKNYFQTYVERDLRQLINIKDLTQFEHFCKILAGRIGSLLNMEEIGNEIGISSHTVKQWISILEASFIVFRLQPYFENFGKRIIKSPKIYFIDVGLACYLLGIEDENQLSRDPARGHLVENLVITELLKARFNKGLDPNLYFYRDQQKNEVDVIYKHGHELIPIEIKSSMTFNSSFLKSLNFFQKLNPERAKKGFLIYAGNQEQNIHSFTLLNYNHTFKALED